MTVAVKNNPPLVVPPAALRRAGFKRGQLLEVKTASGVITIVPKAAGEIPPAARRALSRGIDQSLKEYRGGIFAGPFDTAEEFLADLHQEAAKLDAKKRKRAGK